MNFGGAKTQEPTRLNKVQINQSLQGLPLPVGMGAFKVQQSILDVEDFTAIRVSNGGKGMGGGKGGGGSYNYSANVLAALVAGPISGVIRVIANGSSTTSAAVKYTLFNGADGQGAWALFTTKHPIRALTYNKIAYVAYAPMDLGSGATIQQNVFEVFTPDGFGGGFMDCDPVHCILRVLTDKTWGLGGTFPSNVIDNGAGGTWGYEGGPASGASARNWFASHSFFISPVIDRQETAASVIGKWLEAGACATFMSCGQMKLVPYGDTDATGNGLTWTAPTTFATALDDTCFLADAGEDPVDISSAPWQDANNKVQIQWNNRGNQYAPEVTPDWDQAAIDRYGLRIEDPQTYDFICIPEAAKFAASMRVRRNVYTRNTYSFKLPYRFVYLEPMDVVTISTQSSWGNASNLNLGIVNRPVRITKIVDNPDGTLEVTAEDYLGANHPTIYNRDITDGNAKPDLFADPGDTEAVLFEAPSRLTGYQGNEIWMGAAGASVNWGGCYVLASQDGSTYKQIGEIKSAARLGALHSSLPAGLDPDTVNSIVVDLLSGCSPLDSATHADADNGNTLCYVNGEIIGYSSCTVSAPDQYTLSGYLRRGQMGTLPQAHTPGGLFLRLDDAVFQYKYDPTWAGKTIYLKFQSFNVFRNAAQDLSTITPVTFTIPGKNPGTVDASTGVVTQVVRGGSNTVAALDESIPPINTPRNGIAFDNPGWLTWQAYINAGVVSVVLTQPGSNAGYVFKLDGRTGNSLATILRVSDITAVGNGEYIGSWSAGNIGDKAGWYKCEVCITPNGYMAFYLDGVLSAWAWDNTYKPGGVARYGRDVNALGKIAPGTTNLAGSSSLNGQGSIVPTQALPQPTWTWTANSVTLNWSAATLMRSDGSALVVAAGTKVYSGLASSTRYYFYPYIRVSDGTIQFANSTPPPTTVDATAAIQAAMDGRIQLSPFNVATSAVGGGAGSGGGDTSCPDSLELVEVQERGVIPVKDVITGDLLKGYSFNEGKDVYRRVLSTRTAPCAAWRIVDGHKVSPCETVYRDGGYVPAFRVPGATFDPSIGLKVEIRVDATEDECNYWLVSGTPLLTHNYMANPS